MNKRDLARWRLRSQRLSGSPSASAAETVGWLGALQAQDYPLAKWSVGQRTVSATDAELDALLADGTIVRTHILRPTWHFILPADIRWLMALTGPRVEMRLRARYLQLGLDSATLARARQVIERGLADGRRLTRREIGSPRSGGYRGRHPAPDAYRHARRAQPAHRQRRSRRKAAYLRPAR